MNIDIFLEKLKGTNDLPWRVGLGGGIRLNNPADRHPPYCPITAVCSQEIGILHPEEGAAYAGRELGLSYSDTARIIRASDYTHTIFHDILDLRSDILEALRLGEGQIS